jgi:cyanate permease
VGPTVLGGLRDAFDGYTVPFVVIAVVAALQLLAAVRLSPRRADARSAPVPPVERIG